MSIPESLFNATEAIALKYDGETAPTLSAKGEQELAQSIIELALAYEIPIYENAELTRWLGRLELGDEIPAQLYQIIAEILAFVYAIEGKTPEQAGKKPASKEDSPDGYSNDDEA